MLMPLLRELATNSILVLLVARPCRHGLISTNKNVSAFDSVIFVKTAAFREVQMALRPDQSQRSSHALDASN